MVVSQYIIKIYQDPDGRFMASCPNRSIAVVDDNHSSKLVFVRPPEFIGYDLNIYFQVGCDEYQDVADGNDEYLIPSTLTQGDHLEVMPSFTKGSDYKKSTNPLKFTIRRGLDGCDPPPQPLPDPIIDIETEAFFKVTTSRVGDSVTQRFLNRYGDEVDVSQFSAGGGGGSGVVDINATPEIITDSTTTAFVDSIRQLQFPVGTLLIGDVWFVDLHSGQIFCIIYQDTIQLTLYSATISPNVWYTTVEDSSDITWKTIIESYNDLQDKPSVDGVPIQGDASSDDMPFVKKRGGYDLSENDFTTYYKSKVDGIEEYANKTVQATQTTLGTIKAAPATVDDTKEVHIDEDGFLKIAPSDTEIPIASETIIGGIHAKSRTTETREVAIDPVDHKLYAPAAAAQQVEWDAITGDPSDNVALQQKFDQKVDTVEGMGLSQNDLTDQLKAQYDEYETKKANNADVVHIQNVESIYGYKSFSGGASVSAFQQPFTVYGNQTVTGSISISALPSQSSHAVRKNDLDYAINQVIGSVDTEQTGSTVKQTFKSGVGTILATSEFTTGGGGSDSFMVPAALDWNTSWEDIPIPTVEEFDAMIQHGVQNKPFILHQTQNNIEMNAPSMFVHAQPQGDSNVANLTIVYSMRGEMRGYGLQKSFAGVVSRSVYDIATTPPLQEVLDAYNVAEDKTIELNTSDGNAEAVYGPDHFNITSNFEDSSGQLMTASHGFDADGAVRIFDYRDEYLTVRPSRADDESIDVSIEIGEKTRKAFQKTFAVESYKKVIDRYQPVEFDSNVKTVQFYSIPNISEYNRMHVQLSGTYINSGVMSLMFQNAGLESFDPYSSTPMEVPVLGLDGEWYVLSASFSEASQVLVCNFVIMDASRQTVPAGDYSRIIPPIYGIQLSNVPLNT